MKILVSGGTGLLGQSIVRQYQGAFDIRFMGRDISKGEALAQETGAEFFGADLQDQTQLNQACQGIDGVIHCAALSSPWGRKSAFYQANVEGTSHLLNAATDNHISKFVHISTPSVYFQFQDGLNIREDQVLGPRFCNHYATTKAIAETKVIDSPLDSVILRPRGLFGPHDNAILPRLIGAIRGNTLWVPSSRNPLVDFTYVDNVADAAILALTQPTQKGDIFNITNGEPVPLLDVIQRIFSALNQKADIKTLSYDLLKPLITASQWLHEHLPQQPEPTLTRYSAALFHYQQTLDISKAKTQLNYQPNISIEEGIQRYVRWYQNQSI